MKWPLLLKSFIDLKPLTNQPDGYQALIIINVLARQRHDIDFNFKTMLAAAVHNPFERRDICIITPPSQHGVLFTGH